MRILKISLTTLALISTVPAEGAIRTIQFGGVAGADFSTAEVNNANLSAQCTVSVVNTGTTQQRITALTFMGYDSSSQNTTGNAWAAPDQMQVRNASGGAQSDTTCINQILDEGGVCLARIALSTFSMDGRYTVCAGRFTIEDVTASSPGSAVASGTVTMHQETMVLGGVLSGAYYASGTHLQAGANLAGAGDGGGAPDPTGLFSYNMNYYCTNACQQWATSFSGSAQANWCNHHCGAAGYTESDNPTADWSFLVASYSVRPTGWAVAASPAQVHGCSGTVGASAANMTCTESTVAQEPTYIMRPANAHFAGGMVYEMIMGPLTSICSGNKAFFNQGGDDFTHADGVDAHAIIKGTNTSYPPERLLCVHRHAKDDLYMRTGSTTTFPINGGTPF